MLEALIQAAATEAIRILSSYVKYRDEDKRLGPSKPPRLRYDKEATRDAIKSHVASVDAWSNRIDILGMPRPKSLNDIYIDLSLTDDPKKLRLGESEKIRYTVDAAAEKHKKIMILGDPGSGKTTSLKKLARAALDTEESNQPSAIPLLIKLRDFSKKLTILKFLTATLELEIIHDESAGSNETADYKALAAFLSKIRASVLIDGLDELHPGRRKNLLKEIEQISHNGTTMALSCRSADFKRKPNGFALFEIEELSDDQYRDFTSSWFEADNRRHTAEQFDRVLREKPYSDLANRPLTLAHLCLVFEKTGRLPSHPVSIYRRMVRLLIEEWDESRGVERLSKYSHFDPDIKIDFLANFAYELTFRGGSGSPFTQRLLQAIYSQICSRFNLPKTEASIVSQEIESHTGIITKTSYETYEFCHKSIQEYLAAEHMSRLRYTPPLEQVLKICPNEFAIAVALSTDSSIFFCSLFHDKKDFTQYSPEIYNVTPFLHRIALERPLFGPSAELGNKTLWIATRWKEELLQCEQFYSLRGIKESMRLCLGSSKVELISNNRVLMVSANPGFPCKFAPVEKIPFPVDWISAFRPLNSVFQKYL